MRFFGCTALVTQLLEAREDRQLQRLLTQLQKQDLLILDELGYVPFSKAGSELLFEVVSRAYERQSLIMTSNLPFENWTEVCGSERLTGAMLDRLYSKRVVHFCSARWDNFTPPFTIYHSQTNMPVYSCSSGVKIGTILRCRQKSTVIFALVARYRNAACPNSSQSLAQRCRRYAA